MCPALRSVQSCRVSTSRAGALCTTQPDTTAPTSSVQPWTWMKVFVGRESGECVCVCVCVKVVVDDSR